MNADAVQRVYDEVLAAAERNTPGKVTPAAREWLARVRRLKWAAAWYATGGPGVVLPPPPPLPGSGGGSGPGVGVSARSSSSSTDATTLPNDQAGDGQTDTTDGPQDQQGSSTTDAPDTTDSDAFSVAVEAATASQTSLASHGLPIPAAFTSVRFSTGVLAPSWAVIKETWTQTDGVLSCSANVSGKAIILQAGLTMSGLHNVNTYRPSGLVTAAGPVICASVNASGETSGYAFIVGAAFCEIWRIDNDVWTSLGSALHGGWAAGNSATLQRNGGNVRAFINGVNKITVADATYPSGLAGIAATGAGAVTNLWTNQ